MVISDEPERRKTFAENLIAAVGLLLGETDPAAVMTEEELPTDPSALKVRAAQSCLLSLSKK